MTVWCFKANIQISLGLSDQTLAGTCLLSKHLLFLSFDIEQMVAKNAINHKVSLDGEDSQTVILQNGRCHPRRAQTMTALHSISL